MVVDYQGAGAVPQSERALLCRREDREQSKTRRFPRNEIFMGEGATPGAGAGLAPGNIINNLDLRRKVGDTPRVSFGA